MDTVSLFHRAPGAKFDSPEGIQVWEYLKDIFQYSHPSSVTIYESMSDPLLLEEVWVNLGSYSQTQSCPTRKPDLFVAFLHRPAQRDGPSSL